MLRVGAASGPPLANPVISRAQPQHARHARHAWHAQRVFRACWVMGRADSAASGRSRSWRRKCCSRGAAKGANWNRKWEAAGKHRAGRHNCTVWRTFSKTCQHTGNPRFSNAQTTHLLLGHEQEQALPNTIPH